jgi:SPFH domain / Band 7 family
MWKGDLQGPQVADSSDHPDRNVGAVSRRAQIRRAQPHRQERVMKRIILFVAVAAAVTTFEAVYLTGRQGPQSTAAAVAQVNGGAQAAGELRSLDAAKDIVPAAGGCLILAAAAWAAAPWLRRPGLRARLSRAGSKVGILGLTVMLPWLAGCKPYDRPEYVEIDTSETGFLIPLEGDGTAQARFQSEDYLRQRKVAAKRIQITHRWSQEGRMEWDGRWIAGVRLVKVNRAPVTREWKMSERPASDALRRPDAADRAIWIESADSVGFSMGFTCTAHIVEEDAARFLYWYPSGTLADVMDHEMRGRIQQVAAEVAAKYPLDQLRSKKQEITDAVRKDLSQHFANRGITVSTVGMFGGMTYENPAIQKSIDETFIAQQLKVVAAAKLEAQMKENEKIRLEAEGQAEKARREALGLADARKTGAEAEATAIREINKAAIEAQSNPLFLQLKTLEVEKARIERWDGRWPQTWLGGASPNLLMALPNPPTNGGR